MTFAERFCSQHGLPPAEFERAVLVRCLHPVARLAGLRLGFLAADYFAADREFVRDVGRLTRTRDFFPEASAFWNHPANSGWLRRHLRLRLSTHRLLRLVQATMRDDGNSPAAARGSGAMRAG